MKLSIKQLSKRDKVANFSIIQKGYENVHALEYQTFLFKVILLISVNALYHILVLNAFPRLLNLLFHPHGYVTPCLKVISNFARLSNMVFLITFLIAEQSALGSTLRHFLWSKQSVCIEISLVEDKKYLTDVEINTNDLFASRETYIHVHS